MLDLVFWAAHAVGLVGWGALVLAPRLGTARAVGFARAAGAAVAFLYLGLFLAFPGGMAQLAVNYSPEGIASVFSDPALATVGWVHYVAFDLWVGSWEVEDAERTGVVRPILLLCLFLTAMVGPIGLLAYLLARRLHRKSAA